MTDSLTPDPDDVQAQPVQPDELDGLPSKSDVKNTFLVLLVIFALIAMGLFESWQWAVILLLLAILVKM